LILVKAEEIEYIHEKKLNEFEKGIFLNETESEGFGISKEMNTTQV
jgi:hypothetical protein